MYPVPVRTFRGHMWTNYLP